MAKRYTRINWVPAPSTATEITSERLNVMDKGIDDCDNAIETLNNNLADYEEIIPVTFVSGVTGFCVKNNRLKIARLYVSIQTAVANNSVVGTLPQKVWGASNAIANALAYQGSSIGRVAITVTGGNGNIVASAVEYNLAISYINVYLEWPTAS